LHAMEAERDAAKAEVEGLKTGLERAKQHVTVLQARRDVMREEINRMRERLGMAPDSPA
jgi:predicted  nucleic acid-binding Zn-ribbon protein